MLESSGQYLYIVAWCVGKVQPGPMVLTPSLSSRPDNSMRVSWNDLLLAFDFVSGAPMAEHQAFLCKTSGRIYWRSDSSDEWDELAEDIEGSEKAAADETDKLSNDIEDEDKYLAIPDKRELDLGKPLALDFASEFLPEDFANVRRMFSKRGAYANFKALLARRRALERWYDFEAKATEKALRAWCEANSIEIAE
jgi:hypothetical protein